MASAETHATDAEATAPATADAEASFAYGAETEGPLAGRAARGVAWVAGARLAIQVVQFASSLVLARLLLPSQYGLAAIAWTVTSFAFLFSDLGLSAWLVQSPKITDRDAATAFWINALAGLCLTAIVFGLSDPLAALFGHPRLAGLLRIASFAFTLSLTAVPNALLERRLQFNRIAVVDMTSQTTGFAVTVTCAALGLGAASLVIGPLVATTVGSTASIIASRWLPTARPSRASARRQLGFGGHLTGFTALAFWANNIDNMLIGRFVGTRELGFYNRAYMLMMMPFVQVNSVLGRVLLPVLSAVRGDAERLRRAVMRLCRTNATLLCPLLIGLATVSHNFILVAFGSRWLGAAPLVAILCLSGPPQVAARISGLVCQATGQARLLTTWGNLGNLSTIVAIAAGLPWGAKGVCIAFTARAYLMFPVAVMPAKRAMGLGSSDVFRVSLPAYIASAEMAAFVLAIGLVFGDALGPAACLAVQVVVGAAVYLASLLWLDAAAVLDLVSVVRRRIAA